MGWSEASILAITRIAIPSASLHPFPYLEIPPPVPWPGNNYAPYGAVIGSYGTGASNYGYAGEWTETITRCCGIAGNRIAMTQAFGAG